LYTLGCTNKIVRILMYESGCNTLGCTNKIVFSFTRHEVKRVGKTYS
jgi:hypothetical protein